MELSSRFSASGMGGLQVLSEDGGLVFRRGWREGAGGGRKGVLVVLPASEQPAPATVDRLAHEYSFKDELDGTWAVRPLELVRDRGQTILVLEDPGGELLGGLLGAPMEVGRFLRLAVGVAAALGKVHQRGLIHKDIKPANILVNTASGEVRLTGFGMASRLPRERQPPDPPEVIAGTLAYMAPEQTGRMNRSDRFTQRPLFARRDTLRNADREPSLYGFRSDGMGPLPYCTAGSMRPVSGRAEFLRRFRQS